ncbi:type ISP restriction/modification enzyme [Microbacterium sp. CFBP 8794]|uniref:type ISP restriction/modification enzyme n=1 Tax=Microbacterium sp. CFBP 8794 TaxID=2775269 RepID=UPI00177E79D1|nr:type ISP restriction/modification enzyme [Microbacterium sp. CFBP 8794]MBD8477023.1 N-6 DNA methylase [Microbacterium sp. CFBP 8794]
MSVIEPVRIFLSYKKDDEPGDRRGRRFIDELVALVKARASIAAMEIVLWYDRDLATGQEWEEEIRKELARADVFVLAYSARFFDAAGFIAKHELPTITARIAKTPIVPVVRNGVQLPDGIPPAFAALRRVQAAAEGQAIDELDPDSRAAALDALADDVLAAAARAVAGRLSSSIRPVVERLIDDVAKIYADQAARIGTNPEDQLKVPVVTAFNNLAGIVTGRKLTVNTEDGRPSDEVTGVRLDIAVIDKSGYRVGHTELKAPTKGANPASATGMSGWTAHDRAQWQSLKGLPNLIYSNGYDWTLFRGGVKVADVRLGDFAGHTLPDVELRRFGELITQFLQWSPQPPRTARALAKRLAPLARLLRDAVRGELELSKARPLDKLSRMHRTWQEVLMPDATLDEFADSVAQTFTYGLLLARVEDQISLPLDPDDVAQALRSHGHRLLGSVLDLFADKAVRSRLEEPIGLIESAVAAVDPSKLSGRKNTWLYFYEDFLAEYDPKLRKDAGVYYTPVEVVQAQVRMIDSVLISRLGKAKGLASPDVAVLDPAVGTGTYLLAVAERALSHAESAGLPLHDVRRQLRRRLHGFEILIGAYSVAHLRLSQLLQVPTDAEMDSGVHIYLSDTLSAPMAEHGSMSAPPLFVSEVFDNIVEERRRASVVKSGQTPVQVVIGNPPYDRSKRSSDASNVVLHGVPGSVEQPPLIDVFRDPVIQAGKGQAIKHNLDDPYVHFLRWSIWKAAEQTPGIPGIVSLITNSSYLRSSPFLGVREHMRRMFDEIWILDLGGDNRGARPEPNVFNIQTPVCIVVALQRPTQDDGKKLTPAARQKKPARVWYRRVGGTRDEKLEELTRVVQLDPTDASWQEVVHSSREWGARFVPDGVTDFWRWPELTDLFPWQHSGAQYTRSWPIAPDPAMLEHRWAELYASGSADSEMFKESRGKRARPGVVAGVTSRPRTGQDLMTGQPLPALDAHGAKDTQVAATRYGFRSFDRMWCLADTRLGDFLRAPLWATYSGEQVYFATMTQSPLGRGPAVTVSANVPDLHFFSGRGTKDVIPMWRDVSAANANINHSLLTSLGETYGESVDASDVFAYVFALLGTSAYTERFADDLAESAPRVPLTTSRDLFHEAADLGKKLIRWGTYGERFGELNAYGQRVATAASGSAILSVPTSDGPYPTKFRYDADARELFVGSGVFANVRPDVWGFEVSKLRVVPSWLGYRMRDRKGKKTSPLDSVSPAEWRFDTELLELLHVVEAFVDATKEGSDLLDRIMAHSLVSSEKLPSPTRPERLAPVGGALVDVL